MTEPEMYDAKIELFPYRTATVVNRFFAIDYTTEDDVWTMKQHLFQSQGVEMPDNHCCFRLTKEDGSTLCIQFSDWKAYFGSTIIEKET